VVLEKGPELAGFLCDRLVSGTAHPWFGRRTGAFFSGQESRFPAAETAVGRDSVRMGQLFDRKPEHLVLAGPFDRQVGEADNSHAMRESSFDRSLDEVGREEG
jgi:hypothetical protein